jgi:hypothetical protein
MQSDAAILGDLAATWPQSHEIERQLASMIETRSTEDVRQIIGATQLDWLADKATTDLLFEILGIIHERIKRQ